MAYRFKSTERLKSKRAFEKLFKEGKSIKKYPLRLVYVEWPSASPTHVQVAFSVPKKRFKRAVDRNRLKRQMREAYRLVHFGILTKPKQHWALLFIYLPSEKLGYPIIEKAVANCLHRFAETHTILK
jgi:ribonuclease P protein component